MGKKRSKIKCYEKLLKKDCDFDFGYLLDLERFKLKRMVHSFENASVPHVGIEYTIRDMKMCVKLLDIIFEDDAPSKMYSDAYLKVKLFDVEPKDENSYSRFVRTDQKIPKFPVRINIRNAKRFWKNWSGEENSERLLLLLPEIRRMKALFLYNKLRNRCFRWWW